MSRYCLGYLGVIAAQNRDTRNVERISQILSQTSRPYLLGNHTRWRARIAAASDRPEQAIALLQASLAQGQKHGLSLHADTDLLPLHDDARFQQLVRPRR